MKREIHNRKYLKELRKDLRNNATSAEATLWRYLKGRQLEGRKFRRQHSIENAVVDFYCPSEKLIIELDGQGHAEKGQNLWDSKRDERLQELGFTVLRFENRIVFEDIEGLLEEIKAHFTK